MAFLFVDYSLYFIPTGTFQTYDVETIEFYQLTREIGLQTRCVSLGVIPNATDCV